MLDVGKSTLGELGDVEERAPDEMLDTGFLSCVRHRFTLLHLYICASTLPVIGHSEDSICTLQGRLQCGGIIQIGLSRINSALCVRDPMVYQLTAAVSAPKLSKAFADGFVVSRVMPRTAHDSLILESPRTALTTDPPWIPVAPKTTRSFLVAIAIGRGVTAGCLKGLDVN